jgi:site-specific DNA-cytosine methylase
MGFPIDYFLYGGVTSQQKQLGNAVCPPVAKVIAEGLKDEIASP